MSFGSRDTLPFLRCSYASSLWTVRCTLERGVSRIYVRLAWTRGPPCRRWFIRIVIVSSLNAREWHVQHAFALSYHVASLLFFLKNVDPSTCRAFALISRVIQLPSIAVFPWIVNEQLRDAQLKERTNVDLVEVFLFTSLISTMLVRGVPGELLSR